MINRITGSLYSSNMNQVNFCAKKKNIGEQIANTVLETGTRIKDGSNVTEETIE